MTLKENLLVTMGARAAYMHDRGDIELPSGVEGETQLAEFVLEKVEYYVETGYMMHNYDEYIETALMNKYGVSMVTDEEWNKAIAWLNQLIVEYACIGPAGRFGLDGVLAPLKKRYESGERSKELYDSIMKCK